MSGHSKWSTIKRQKESNDQKRGQLFTKLAGAITIAVKEGSGDNPETNFKLRLVIDKAKEANMPKNNIDRAIRRGLGQEGGNTWSQAVYEGFGPFGISLLVEVLTDNRNRTSAALKNYLDKRGGNLAGPGAVAFQFNSRGRLVVSQQKDKNAQEMKLMDLDILDLKEEGNNFVLLTVVEKLQSIREEVVGSEMEVKEVELVSLPKTTISLDEGKREKVIRFIEGLEEMEEVQQVFSNV